MMKVDTKLIANGVIPNAIALASALVFCAACIFVSVIFRWSVDQTNVADWLGFAGALIAIPVSIVGSSYINLLAKRENDRKTAERVLEHLESLANCLDEPIQFPHDIDQCVRHFNILCDAVMMFFNTAIDLDSRLIYHFTALKHNLRRDRRSITMMISLAQDAGVKAELKDQCYHVRRSTEDCVNTISEILAGR